MRTAGVIHLPGDRHREGVMLTLSVRENVSLLALGETGPAGFVARSRERSLVAAQIDRYVQEDAADGLRLVARADEALYASKRGGRNRVIVAAG